MKVLFLNPSFKGKFSRTSRSPAVTRGGTIYYPFWLAYSAGVLDRSGFEISVIDGPAEGLSLEQTVKMACEFKPKLIVVDTSTPSIYSDIETAAILKKNIKNSFVVLVGTHPSALPAETLEINKSIDAVAKGEYDYTIRDLAFALKNNEDIKKVDGLFFRKNNEIIQNKPRQLIENIDDIPFASEVYKKYFNIKKYFFGASDWPMIMIITGRGCPFRCFFCVYPQTFHSRNYRFRSPKSVADEFEYISKELPWIKEVGIEDDTFTADKERVREICRLILERRIKIKWYCNVRADVDQETMRAMKKAGCHMLTVGFESGDQEVLNNIKKGITVEQIKKFVADAKKVGILVHGCFMAGNPGETKETMEKTLQLAKELNCDSMQFYPLIVYPGTEAYQWASQNNYLISKSFDKWALESGLYNCVLSFPHLKPEEIIAFCNRAFKEYYLRPSYIFMKLKKAIFDPREMIRTLKSAKTFFKYLKQT